VKFLLDTNIISKIRKRDLVACVFEIEGKALCVGAGLVPARLAAAIWPGGRPHQGVYARLRRTMGRPYERTDPFNLA
jgi:hypothetical protein